MKNTTSGFKVYDRVQHLVVAGVTPTYARAALVAAALTSATGRQHIVYGAQFNAGRRS